MTTPTSIPPAAEQAPVQPSAQDASQTTPAAPAVQAPASAPAASAAPAAPQKPAEKKITPEEQLRIDLGLVEEKKASPPADPNAGPGAAPAAPAVPPADPNAVPGAAPVAVLAGAPSATPFKLAEKIAIESSDEPELVKIASTAIQSRFQGREYHPEAVIQRIAQVDSEGGDDGSRNTLVDFLIEKSSPEEIQAIRTKAVRGLFGDLSQSIRQLCDDFIPEVSRTSKAYADQVIGQAQWTVLRNKAWAAVSGHPDFKGIGPQNWSQNPAAQKAFDAMLELDPNFERHPDAPLRVLKMHIHLSRNPGFAVGSAGAQAPAGAAAAPSSSFESDEVRALRAEKEALQRQLVALHQPIAGGRPGSSAPSAPTAEEILKRDLASLGYHQ